MNPKYVPIPHDRLQQISEHAAKYGARIAVINSVCTQQDLEWAKSVNLVHPILTTSNILKSQVETQYQPVKNGVDRKDIVLLNYPNRQGNLRTALAWSREVKMKAADPRKIFAMGEQHPELCEVLDQKPVFLVSPVMCTILNRFFVCQVVYEKNLPPIASLDWDGNFNTAHDWFAFFDE